MLASEASVSPAGSQPRTCVTPCASAPNNTARCEIDLSPGTVVEPFNGVPGLTTNESLGVVILKSPQFLVDSYPPNQKTSLVLFGLFSQKSHMSMIAVY